MASITSPMSRGQGHELLNKLEAAGLGEREAQAIIGSRDNQLAKQVVEFTKTAILEYVPGTQRVVITLGNSETGGDIANEMIQILDAQGQVFSQDRTDGNGRVNFDLPPGDYKIKVHAFFGIERRDIHIPVRDPFDLRFTFSR